MKLLLYLIYTLTCSANDKFSEHKVKVNEKISIVTHLEKSMDDQWNLEKIQNLPKDISEIIDISRGFITKNLSEYYSSEPNKVILRNYGYKKKIYWYWSVEFIKKPKTEGGHLAAVESVIFIPITLSGKVLADVKIAKGK